MQERLFLIGFMGTGKTTVGLALANELKYAFYDSDQEIVKREGMEISQLFASKGEAYFRQVEAAVLSELSRLPKSVITTGGGVVLKQANRQLMQQSGYVVALSASPEEIVRRVEQDRSRPLLQSESDLKERVTELMRKRAGLYDFANLTVATTDRSVESIIAEIKQNLSISSH
ncbi:shikimate kinase [Tumebacillus lipolyticus]|uniref:Shikimate kinase n=1 Tax=Tumebacillus lipolyticus TaxID=1280370 RepID=A0ABW4ZTK2_9BACL